MAFSRRSLLEVLACLFLKVDHWLVRPYQSGATEFALKVLELFGRARPELGLAHFRVHDLRRTVATGMASLGVNPHTISLVLDHISATKGTIIGAVYVKYSFDREKRDALE
jgi:integrase